MDCLTHKHHIALLTKNSFVYDETMYTQKGGAVIGYPQVSSCAGIFMEEGLSEWARGGASVAVGLSCGTHTLHLFVITMSDVDLAIKHTSEVDLLCRAMLPREVNSRSAADGENSGKEKMWNTSIPDQISQSGDKGENPQLR